MKNVALSRPAFLAGTAAALALRTTASAADLKTLTLGGTPDADLIGSLWGVKSGVFQKNGLDLQVQRLNSGAAVSAAVIGGSINIGKSSIFGLLSAYSKGVPLVLEAVADVYESKAPNTAFVVAKTSTISGPKDLAGKTIASPALGDLFSTMSGAWIEAGGGNPKASNFIELPIPLIPNALTSGRVDGAMLVQPYLTQALANGCKAIGYPFNLIANYFGVTYYFTMRSYAQANVDALARFRRALAEATNYALKHQGEMAPVIVDYTKMDPSTINGMPLEVGVGIEQAPLQATIDFAAKIKYIPAGFSASAITDPAALAR